MHKICKVEECPTKSRTRDMCDKHYRRWKSHGDPLKVSKLVGATLNDRLDFYTVKASDGCWLWQASLNSSGYGQINNPDGSQLAHRLMYERYKGSPGAGVDLDHRHDCPKTCVNPDHLRPTTRKQNMENSGGTIASNKSGYTGVCWNKRKGSWRATVTHNQKQVYLGSYKLYELHVAAYYARMKRNELFTHNDLDRAV